MTASATVRRPACCAGAAVILLLLALCAPGAQAAALDGTLEVRSAYVTVDGGVFQLNVRTLYPVNDEIRAALKDGVTLTFDLQAVVERRRRFWFDAALVDVTRRREVSWHAVSERFVVKDLERGEQESCATLEQALERVGTIEGWPVIVEPQLARDATYEIRVRASVRRGNLPDALRAVIWWSEGWQRSSEWYAWSLPR